VRLVNDGVELHLFRRPGLAPPVIDLRPMAIPPPTGVLSKYSHGAMLCVEM
jgi:hypothetical protein